MEAEFWHERWRNNQIGFHQDYINPWLEKYWNSLNLEKGAHVFVPLCGKTRDMLWLMEQGYRVTGIEISEIAVETFFRESDLIPAIEETLDLKRWRYENLSIFSGDIFALRAADIGAVRGIYDRAALIAFPPEMRHRYAAHVSGLLSPGARGLLVSLEYPAGEMEGPPFAVFETEVCELFSQGWKIDVIESSDCLEENTKFRERGLSELREVVYRLGFSGTRTRDATDR